MLGKIPRATPMAVPGTNIHREQCIGELGSMSCGASLVSWRVLEWELASYGDTHDATTIFWFQPCRHHIQHKKVFPNTRFLSNSLLDVRTDSCRRHPMEEHALHIDVSVFTLHRELHLMPKWHAKAFITPFIMISAANLVDVRRPIDSGMETPLDTNTSSQPKIFEI